MATESTAILGSGLNPLKKSVCAHSDGNRYIHGTNVNVVNPEDASAGCSGRVTVMTVVTTAVQVPPTPLLYRRSISVCNNDASRTLYLGFDPSVSTGTGFPLPPGTAFSMDINGDIQIWAIGDDDTDVRILELS